MKRKQFIRNIALGGSVLITAPMVFNSCSKSDDVPEDNTGNDTTEGVTVDLTNADYSDLETVGGFAYKGNIIIIRSTDTVYLAFSKVCTHQSCTVTYDAASNQMPCPCHGSVFSIDGGVVNGPAPSALTKYTVTKEGNTLTIV